MFTAGCWDKEKNLFCWILSLGDQIELLEPSEFRAELAELGRRIYEYLQINMDQSLNMTSRCPVIRSKMSS